MVHVVSRAGDTGVVQPALPNQLQQVVHTGQDIVHEHDRVEMLSVVISLFMERYESGVSHFSQIFDTMVKITPRSHRGANFDPQPSRPTKRIKYPQEGFCLIVRPILVDRHVDVLETKDGRDLEESRKQVGYDIERVIQVDSKEVLVVVGGMH